VKKRTFAWILAAAFVMQLLKVPQGVYSNADNNIFKENFELSSVLFDDGGAEFNSVVESGLRGIGKSYRGLGSAKSNVFESSDLLDASGNADSYLGSDCYIETEFDFLSEKTEALESGSIALSLASSYTDAYVYTTVTIDASDDKAKFTHKNGTKKTEVTLGDVADGEWNNFRIVIHATDSNGKVSKEIEQIYFNGMPCLESQSDFVSTKKNYLKGYDSFYIECTGLGSDAYWQIDNFIVNKYNSSDGVPERTNKYGLINLLRSADKALSDAENYEDEDYYYTEDSIEEIRNCIDAAALVWENPSADQSEIDDAVLNLQSKLEVFSPVEKEDEIPEIPPTEDTEPTVVVQEDFEDGTGFFDIGSGASDTVIQTDVRGIGKVYRGHMSQRSFSFEPVHILKGAQVSPSVEGANFFVETEFDFKSEKMSTLPQGLIELKLTSDYAANNTKAFFTVTYNVASGKITYKNGNQTVEIDDIKDEWCNFRIVIQATDADSNPISKVVQLYYNGKPQLSEPINFTQTDLSVLGAYNQFYVAGSGFGDYNSSALWQFDNFKVTKYNRADGEILRTDKFGLLTAIRKADEALKASEKPAPGIYYPEGMVQSLTVARDNALIVYEEKESTEQEISESTEKILLLLETFIPQEIKVPFSYIIENDFENKTSAPFEFSTYEKVSAPYVGTAAVLVGSASSSTYKSSSFDATYLLDSSDETKDAFSVEGANCDVTTELDVMFKGLVQNGAEFQIELANKDSSDKTPILRLKFMGKGAKMAVQRGASFTDISAENIIEDNVWYNLKIVVNATNDSGADKKIDVYLNNSLISGGLALQTTTVGKADKYDQITLSGIASAKASVYLDGFKIYKTTPYTSDVPTDYAYPVYVLRKCFSFFEKSVVGDGVTDYDEPDYNALKNKYDAVTDMIESGKLQAETDEAAGELFAMLSGIKPNGEPVIVKSITASKESLTASESLDVSVSVKTGKKAALSNNITAIVMLCEKSSVLDGGSIKRIFTGKKVISKDSEDVICIPVSLQGFTAEEKGRMYIKTVVFKGDSLLAPVEAENKYLFGLPENVTQSFEKTEDKLVYERVTYEENGEKKRKAQLIIKAEPDSLVGVTVAKLGKTASNMLSDGNNIDYAEVKKTDAKGYACFEIVPSGGSGNYAYIVCGAEYKEGKFYYSTYIDVDNVFKSLKTADSNQAKALASANAELVGIEKKIIENAEVNGIEYGNISVSLFKYNSFDDADKFFKGLSDSIEAITTICTAKTADEVGLKLAECPLISGDVTDYKNATSKVKNASNSIIYDKKSGVLDIESFILILKDAVKEAKKTSGGSSGGGGGGGAGGSGGGGGASSSKAETTGGIPAGVSSSEEEKKSPMDSVDVKFNDIDDVVWAREAIYVLAINGCISGKAENVFAPHDNITREEFLKIALLTFKLNDNTAEIPFVDVDPDSWYAEYVAAAYAGGITNGLTDDTFGVGMPITRQDVAAMVYRMASIKNKSFADDGVYIQFDDENVIADYALEAVKALAGKIIINGMENNLFVPNSYCTRAQAVKILYGVYKLID